MTPAYEQLERGNASNLITITRLKRVLVLLLIAGFTVIAFLYGTQQLNYADSIGWYTQANDEEHKTAALKFEGLKEPKWTWICENNTCLRMPDSVTLTHQSLTTCNMLCTSMPLWPQPTGPVSLAAKAVPVAAEGFTLRIDRSPSNEVTKYLQEAFTFMIKDMSALEQTITNSTENDPLNLYSVTVHVDVDGDDDPKLRLDTDESYSLSLNIGANKTLIANVAAQSFCGARHALETLSQLVWVDTIIGSLLILAKASIEDEPRFKYRGLLLDTARNFFPVSDLLRTIDAMGVNKLNTFHWHATDSQSFPLALKSAPQLSRLGAYGPAAIYTPDDVRAVVHRARIRGIRVVIEVDGPSHVGSALGYGKSKGLGDLAYCIEQQPWSSYCGEPPCGQINPQNPHVYKLLQKIYEEILELTGVTDVFHIGGDEVNANCWTTNIKGKNPKELWFNFTLSTLEAVKQANGGKLPELTTLWSSGLTQGLYLEKLKSENLTIQLWGSSEWPDQIAILNKGLRSIISHVNAWYLDCGLGSWRDDSFGHCPPYRPWTLVYNHRPWKDPADIWRITGGEACYWTETLGQSGLDAGLWPRGAAFAERLWSDPREMATANVHLRLDTQRTRMESKGIGVMPIWPRWCTQNPNSCLK